MGFCLVKPRKNIKEKEEEENQLRNGAISDAGNGVMEIGDLGIN